MHPKDKRNSERAILLIPISIFAMLYFSSMLIHTKEKKNTVKSVKTIDNGQEGFYGGKRKRKYSAD